MPIDDDGVPRRPYHACKILSATERARQHNACRGGEEHQHEKQGGEERAEYGAKLIKELSARMTEDFGKGFTPTNLKNMRTFYLMFPKGQTLSDQLSWSHYCQIIRIPNEKARQYYHDECAREHWSVRELKRQISTLSYERLIGTGDKEAVKRGTPGIEIPKKPQDIIRDPYVLDFLGLKQNDSFYESDLEQALIDHLQEFMLELGRGFAFVGRQKRITIDGDHFYVDLVFYNYVAQCFVLIDLKTGRLSHQDLGQMQMYVNYYTRELMNEGDNPPVGLVMCADKNESVVRYTLPEGDRQIFVSKCLPNLPSEEELQEEVQRQYNALEDAEV